MTLDESGADNLSGHRRILGACWVAYGILRLVVGVWLFLFQTTATVMFGALLTRVPDPYSLMAEFHIFYLASVVLSFAAGLIGLLAGLALLANQAAGRALGLVAAFLSLSGIPFGVTLGTYTLVVLLPLRGGSAANRS